MEASCTDFVHMTANFVTLRRCFTEDDEELYPNEKRRCGACTINLQMSLLFSTVVLTKYADFRCLFAGSLTG